MIEINLTADQQEALKPLYIKCMSELRKGRQGAIMCQPFPDPSLPGYEGKKTGNMQCAFIPIVPAQMIGQILIDFEKEIKEGEC